MATKFILLPDDIYRGLTAVGDTGDLNLDFTRHSLEKAKRARTNASTKILNYNQELRRYLHMKNERDRKPMNVAVSNADAVAGALFNQPTIVQQQPEIEPIATSSSPFPPAQSLLTETKKKGGVRNRVVKKKKEINIPPPPSPPSNESNDSGGEPDDFYEETIDEEPKRRGIKHKLEIEEFRPKKWPLILPTHVFRESEKKKYEKERKKKPSHQIPIRLGHPINEEEDDEFGDSPPPSPLEWFDAVSDQDSKEEITTTNRRGVKRKALKDDDEKEENKKTKSNEFVPKWAKTRPRKDQLKRVMRKATQRNEEVRTLPQPKTKKALAITASPSTESRMTRKARNKPSPELDMRLIKWKRAPASDAKDKVTTYIDLAPLFRRRQWERQKQREMALEPFPQPIITEPDDDDVGPEYLSSDTIKPVKFKKKIKELPSTKKKLAIQWPKKNIVKRPKGSSLELVPVSSSNTVSKLRNLTQDDIPTMGESRQTTSGRTLRNLTGRERWEELQRRVAKFKNN